MNRLIRRGHPDDYDDQGNYQPGPARPYPRFNRCAERCTGTPLCHDPEGDTNG